MRIISNKPLVHITVEEEKAIQLVAELVDKLYEADLTDDETGETIQDFFFDNEHFNVEVVTD